ncbi:MAG: FprA family A-type flavoprotein [Clostridiales bacterium]|jgi:flavorubredoxin|nr:FprA family A-type flavoprotein [Clostridiales bacterium]
MRQVKEIAKNIYYVGCSDRRLALFENAFPIPRGVSYNSYLVLDEKTVLLDAANESVGAAFFENLEYLLKNRDGSPRPLDYVVVNHAEPDHCALLPEVMRRHPGAKIVGNAKTVLLLSQFLGFDVAPRAMIVRENDTLKTGKHAFTFYMVPMVHWPEAMVAYDATTKTLFSADAFGTFGALSGALFADEMDFERDWLPDARRYYANIVGKYGSQVQALLNKASQLDIQTLCPLHGPLWRENIGWFVEKYRKWSAYEPEDNAVAVFYASVYGHTGNAADILMRKLSERGARDIAAYDVSTVHFSDIVAEAFRAKVLVFASVTYNMGIFGAMETVLNELKAHNFQNRAAAVIENGSWAPAAGALIREKLAGMKNMTLIGDTLTIKSALREDQLKDIDALATQIVSVLKN